MQDYFENLIKAGVAELLDLVATEGKSTLEDLLKRATDKRRIGRVANLASRFFLHGLRMPAAAVPGDLSSWGDTRGLHQFVGQQFPLEAAAPGDAIRLSAREGAWLKSLRKRQAGGLCDADTPGRLGSWPKWPQGSGSTTT